MRITGAYGNLAACPDTHSYARHPGDHRRGDSAGPDQDAPADPNTKPYTPTDRNGNPNTKPYTPTDRDGNPNTKPYA